MWQPFMGPMNNGSTVVSGSEAILINYIWFTLLLLYPGGIKERTHLVTATDCCTSGLVVMALLSVFGFVVLVLFFFVLMYVSALQCHNTT